jgi:hypothetical protein
MTSSLSSAGKNAAAILQGAAHAGLAMMIPGALGPRAAHPATGAAHVPALRGHQVVAAHQVTVTSATRSIATPGVRMLGPRPRVPSLPADDVLFWRSDVF